jgi:hypothetical protein
MITLFEKFKSSFFKCGLLYYIKLESNSYSEKEIIDYSKKFIEILNDQKIKYKLFDFGDFNGICIFILFQQQPILLPTFNPDIETSNIENIRSDVEKYEIEDIELSINMKKYNI